MKIYVSADIEGITGIAHWDEATIGEPGYEEVRRQMTLEVKAACEGAVAAGATEIWIKDAHDSGRNILLDELPHCVRVIRGWSGHPNLMLQELDSSFDAVLLVGYHSTAGTGGNPLAHSISLEVAEMTLNGEPASEFLLHTFEAGRLGVPVVFVSGDEDLCKQAKATLPKAVTVPVLKGVGRSTISIHPEVAIQAIHKGAQRALVDFKKPNPALKLPERFVLRIRYKEAMDAYFAGFYPGTRQIDPTTVEFETRDFFEVMRMLLFTTAE
jgi:D-amino peptidase